MVVEEWVEAAAPGAAPEAGDRSHSKGQGEEPAIGAPLHPLVVHPEDGTTTRLTSTGDSMTEARPTGVGRKHRQDLLGVVCSLPPQFTFVHSTFAPFEKKKLLYY